MKRNFRIYVVLALAFSVALLGWLAVGRVRAATFTVTTTVDNGDDVNPTPGSLRKAILDANAAAGLDTISFNIPGTGVQTIIPASQLPSITDPLIIDGTTQPGYAGSPLIELNGATAAAPQFTIGLIISANGSTLRALAVNRYSANQSYAVFLGGSGGSIQGCYLGTDAVGSAALGNTYGLVVFGDNNTIGGTGTGEGNLISGNNFTGLYIQAAGNTVQGNLVGTDISGTLDLGNGQFGIYLLPASSGNTIGGTVSGARNLVSGNDVDGIYIEGTSNNVLGNYIGTDISGSADLGNSQSGVRLQSGANHTIGGTTAAARNLISGNNTQGILVLSSNTQILGNFIGTNATGTAGIGNSSSGVAVFGGTSNQIGGTVGTTPGGACTGACNLISGNNDNGIRHSNSGTLIIQGNYVGTDVSGNADLGNNSTGISIDSSAPGDTVGGTSAAARNVVSGNNSFGISLGNGGGNTATGNYVGLNSAGASAIGNSLGGVVISSSNNTLGGTAAGAGNIISGHSNRVGVQIDIGSNNTVQGNLIGTDASGTIAFGNDTGVLVSVNSTSNLIGGATPAARNVISGNTGDGILIGRPSNANCCSSSSNTVKGNLIGTDVTGTADLGNGGTGVVIRDSPNNIIGGTMAGERNVISGNNASGIRLDVVFGGTTGNLLQGNLIGTDAAGTSALGNSASGVFIVSSSNNTVGGAAMGAGNLIAFNTGNGVTVSSGTGNAIRGNAIFNNTGPGIDLAADGVTPNDACDGDGGANNLQNFPVIISATHLPGAIRIEGTLNSTASTSFNLDFFINSGCDPSGNGEGQTYLGSAVVMTGSNCIADFTSVNAITLPMASPGTGLRITSTATDPSGNTSEFSSCSSPTAIECASFTATSFENGVRLEWQTGFEADNLGFNIYRDEAGQRTRITPQLVAGSALLTGPGVTLTAGRQYSWTDKPKDERRALYWLEDVDLAGKSTWHGPFYVQQSGDARPAQAEAALLSELGNNQADSTKIVERVATPQPATNAQANAQAKLIRQTLVKILVNREGWTRVTQPELVRAGLSGNLDSRFLQLIVDGREIPIAVATNKDGHFDESSFIEFYGLGLDTPSTDRRAYWLTLGNQAGKRIQQIKGEDGSSSSSSFTHTVERKDRTIYFSSLRNGERENFFGAVIAASPVEQTLNLSNLHRASIEHATLEIALQGVTLTRHRVTVQLNGFSVGEVIFDQQQSGVGKFNLQHSLLSEGANSIRLLAQNGQSDVSLVDYLRLSYQHTFTADDDLLRFSASQKEKVTIGGFSSKAIRVFDVTDEEGIEELTGEISPSKNGYAITIAARQTGERQLLAVSQERAGRAAAITANTPSAWRSPNNAADLVIITMRDFFAALAPLKMVREAEGYKVALIDIEDLYDEFSFGHKTPQALRDFFTYAKANWKSPPRFALLAADASYDAKNYLGFGAFDLVPTKLIDTSYLETASDDWFADFNGDGLADLSVGRLPVRTAEEATNMVQKLLRYAAAESKQSVLLVADANDGFNFEQASAQLKDYFPPPFTVVEINRGELDEATAKARLLNAITSGQRVVNYAGHGSVNLWRGNLLTAEEARGLVNDRLPLFVMMTCLNGYFQDAAMDSLAESLMKAERGGGIAVWTSSGLSLPQDQAAVNRELYRLLFGAQNLTLGEATRRAKLVTGSRDVRQTWVLLGDPTMKLK